MATLSKAEMAEFYAWVALYRCVVENRAQGGEGGWPKGVFDPNAIAEMVADGDVESFWVGGG